VPIVTSTALAYSAIARYRPAGANEYLGKPLKLKQLALTVQQLLIDR
jgi:CheY-like chemotaxis protein